MAYGRSDFTFLLLAAWIGALLLAAVCVLNPAWLQRLAREGVVAESATMKAFGDQALARRDYATAIREYERVLKVRPDYAAAAVNLGTALVSSGQLERGQRVYDETLVRTTSRISRGIILFNKAILAEQAGRRDEALVQYREAIACGTDLPKRYLRLGEFHLTAGEFEEAAEAFRNALQRHTDVALGYRQMLERDVEVFADDPEHRAFFERREGLDLGDEKLARYDLEIIREGQRRDPTTAIIHDYLGWALLNQGQFTEAAEHFAAALAIWPAHPAAQRNLEMARRKERPQSPAATPGAAGAQTSAGHGTATGA